MKPLGDLAFYLKALLEGKAVAWDAKSTEGRLRKEFWKAYQNNTLASQLGSLLEDWYAPSSAMEVKLLMGIAQSILEDDTIDTDRKILEQLVTNIEQQIEPIVL
jgi:hypothetical protein